MHTQYLIISYKNLMCCPGNKIWQVFKLWLVRPLNLLLVVQISFSFVLQLQCLKESIIVLLVYTVKPLLGVLVPFSHVNCITPPFLLMLDCSSLDLA